MRLQKLPDGSLRLSRMNAWDVQTLRNLPVLADFSDHEAAERRLLPSPAIESDLTPEMAMDWVEFVVPELRDSFAANLGVVMSDLSSLKPHGPDPAFPAPSASSDTNEAQRPAPAAASDSASDDGGKEENTGSGTSDAAPGPQPVMDYYTVDIPFAHAEAWFRAMNQARLVLSAKHGIDSENLPDLASLLTSGKLEHWFQYELFVSLQGRLIDMSLDPEPEPGEEDQKPEEEPDSKPGFESDLKADTGTDPWPGTRPDQPES